MSCLRTGQESDHAIILLSVLSVIVCILISKTFKRVWKRVDRTDSVRKIALASFVRAMSAVLWPIVLLTLIIPREEHNNPNIIYPLVWNTLIWFLDSRLLHYSKSGDGRVASISLPPSSITGLTFGLCGMVGSNPTSKYSHLFMYSIIGCLSLVLPSHNLQSGCIEEQLFESIQKSALMWCIGILITAVVLTRQCSKQNVVY